MIPWSSKWVHELAWFVLQTAAFSAAQVVMSTDLERVTDWKVLAAAVCGAAVRSGVTALAVGVTRLMKGATVAPEV